MLSPKRIFWSVKGPSMQWFIHAITQNMSTLAARLGEANGGCFSPYITIYELLKVGRAKKNQRAYYHGYNVEGHEGYIDKDNDPGYFKESP